ncbi:hypothetical protein D4764_08G0006800 [Takifugu flavidus]|uniref:Uncharacterized protein n=1 Tax=Takifugu flavidus TaxID=433684 RepID=A0A5C6MPD2_9TELE|nr:hypothetical protein D4764_08G0006800 [Takifugu flavidus]
MTKQEEVAHQQSLCAKRKRETKKKRNLLHSSEHPLSVFLSSCSAVQNHVDRPSQRYSPRPVSHDPCLSLDHTKADTKLHRGQMLALPAHPMADASGQKLVLELASPQSWTEEAGGWRTEGGGE